MSWHPLGNAVPQSGNLITRFVGRTGMHLCGWRIEGEFPNEPKFIIAVAPHTSNFDFVLTVMVIWGLGLRSSYLAKQSLFRFPLGMIMSHFGGIPVDRGAARGLVEQLTARFNNCEQLILGITPEGTRGKVTQWKKGFALIAQSANVPVLPAIIHASKKIVKFEPLITDVGDPDRTLANVQSLAATAI
ncbi:MAG: 1-acyl-sn-glycerol-3-phosphate acyltransferase [Pseudomonadota bacterium]